MKYFVIIIMLPLILGCSIYDQKVNHNSLIEKFIKYLQNGAGIEMLASKDLLSFRHKNEIEGKVEYYDMILTSIKNQMDTCNSKGHEITIEKYDSTDQEKHSLIIPPEGYIYEILCQEEIITYILIIDDKISSFSTLNKGDRRIFLNLRTKR